MSVYNEMIETGVQAANAMREGWVNETANAPDMAGKLDQIKTDIGRFKDQFIGAPNSKARQEFDAAMTLTGAGDHPAIVRGIWAAAKAANEGTHVAGTGPSPHGQATPSAPRTAAERMYPNLATTH